MGGFVGLKRIFDLTVCALSAVIWLPALLVCSFLLLISSGRPIFYVSARRVYKRVSLPMIKFRTMITNAEKIANRDTVPVAEQRFLNIPPDSPLYTPVGRIFERFCLTELPQLLQVLRGQISLVGNRPLPENVIAAIRREFPYVEERFQVRTGMTGPVQLVGRDNLSDEQRLSLEIEYCQICQRHSTVLLDFTLLLYTVLIGAGLMKAFSPREVESLMIRLTVGKRRELYTSGNSLLKKKLTDKVLRRVS